MMLMIKDISELVQGRTLCKSCSMGVTTSDWEKKGCPFGGGVGEVKVILAQFL